MAVLRQFTITNQVEKHIVSMKRYSEREIVIKKAIDLEYCSLLECKSIISLDELSQLIPGYIHLNDRQTLGINYYSQNALEIFNKSIEEIQQAGRKHIDAISDEKSKQIFTTSLIDFSLNGDPLKTFSFIQRLRENPKARYELYYTTTRHYRDNKNLLSFTQPLQMLNNFSFLKEIVEERYIFYSKHFCRFNTLTIREREILSLIAEGDSSKQISDKLYISLQTVKTHRKNICRKLETGKLIELVMFAQVFLKE